MVLGILDSLFPQARQNVSQQNTNDNKQGLGNRASNILSAFTNPTPSQAAKLAMGFNSLTLDPDPQFTAAMQKRIDDGSAMERANQTAMYLEEMGQTDLANLVRSGGISGGDALSYMAASAKSASNRKTFTDEYGVVRYVDTKERVMPEDITGPLTQDELGAVNTLRDDINRKLEIYTDIKRNYETITKFYDNRGAVSDQALATAFAKIIDPGSVAREGEVKVIAESGALTKALKASILNALSGTGKLQDNVRNEIRNLAGHIYNQQVNEAQKVIDDYTVFLGKQSKKPHFAEAVLLGIERPELIEDFVKVFEQDDDDDVEINNIINFNNQELDISTIDKPTWEALYDALFDDGWGKDLPVEQYNAIVEAIKKRGKELGLS